ncbi:MAG: 5-formyltetrahydrofolate cyclo-ligase [Desulfobacteraceae bacterium]|nr:5-formyltetrahydrofolate cyclo-ligase [Desulfobacteraceae bacterium]
MEEIRVKKQEIRETMANKIAAMASDAVSTKTTAIENQLFEFANFLESRIALLYTPIASEVDTAEIIRRSYMYNKIIVLPGFNPVRNRITLLKVDDPDKDLIKGPRGNFEPDPGRCKAVPLDCLDIAVIPGIAMDEKGGRIGSGAGYYDRFIPNLPITTRKVGLVFEDQVMPIIPMESHDKHVDIVITEKRVIYKI